MHRAPFALALVATLALAVAGGRAEARTLFVCGICDYKNVRTAVNAAADGDIVEIAEGTYFVRGLLIRKNITLHGAGAAGERQTTLLDDGHGPVIQVLAGTTVVVRGLVIGRGDVGIANYGTLTLEGCRISNNHNDGRAGGGIANHGTLVVRGSDIVGNTAASGGGISNAGRVTLEDSLVEGNDATGWPLLATPYVGGLGGGVENQRGATLILINTAVRGNAARRNGGGIDNDERGTVTLDDRSAVENNRPNDCVDC